MPVHNVFNSPTASVSCPIELSNIIMLPELNNYNVCPTADWNNFQSRKLKLSPSWNKSDSSSNILTLNNKFTVMQILFAKDVTTSKSSPEKVC